MITETTELIVAPQAENYAIMPVLDLQLAATRRQAVVDFAGRMMRAGTDYGKIPGTGDKPTLLKPGAEKLASLFGLSPHFEILDREMDWTGKDHGGEPFFYVQYRCTLTRGDLVAGQGVGSCNSWERKYRYRTVYPNKATPEEKEIGRLETRSGRNGTYQVYVVKNPDPADVVNTIDKMAQKRALVAAVLIAVNASELFTQDIEDYSDIVDGDWQPAQAARPAQSGNGHAAPIPKDEAMIHDVEAREFIPAVAVLLALDEETVKAWFRANGVTSVPKTSADRVRAYKNIRDALKDAPADGFFDEGQPELVAVPTEAANGAYND